MSSSAEMTTRMRQWSRLRDEAVATLTGPASMPLPYAHGQNKRLRLSVLPSFQPPATYHIVEHSAPRRRAPDDEMTRPLRSEAWWATRVRWDTRTDRKAMESGPIERPTFTTDVAALDPDLGRQWVASVEGKPCSLIADTMFGTDGVSFELQWFQYFSGVTVRWWFHGPDAWRELTSAAETLLAGLEALPWGPVPPVTVEVGWEMGVPVERELLALRSLVPRFADVPMPDLWKLARERPFQIGTMSLADARALQSRAHELGLTLGLHLPERTAERVG